MPQKVISGKDLSKTINSEDILGKEVIDFDGNFIGVVDKVLIDPKLLDFVGISIDKGLLKKGLTIGKNYINKITTHAVFLKIKVAFEAKGKIVFDRDGRKVGIVSSIELNGNKNNIVNIIVRPTLASLILKKEIRIPAIYIENVGENVMLNVSRENLFQKK